MFDIPSFYEKKIRETQLSCLARCFTISGRPLISDSVCRTAADPKHLVIKERAYIRQVDATEGNDNESGLPPTSTIF